MVLGIRENFVSRICTWVPIREIFVPRKYCDLQYSMRNVNVYVGYPLFSAFSPEQAPGQDQQETVAKAPALLSWPAELLRPSPE